MLEMGEPVRILDLAERMIRLSGYQVGIDIPIEITGIRPGEKLNEVLSTPDEEVLTTDPPLHQPARADHRARPTVRRRPRASSRRPPPPGPGGGAVAALHAGCRRPAIRRSGPTAEPPTSSDPPARSRRRTPSGSPSGDGSAGRPTSRRCRATEQVPA